MAACGGFYGLAWLAYPRGIGLGDVKLVGVLGLFLGYLGWDAVAVGMFAAVLLGALGGVVQIATGRATRRSRIPYGPFLLAGTLLGCLVGHPLAHLYLHVSGV
jgi:leader peptidase (prepilin peptidase) / N-methyltransferase